MKAETPVGEARPTVGSIASVAPPDRNVTIGAGGKRRWVYADLAKGRFARARNIVYSVLLVFYIAAPFLTVKGQPFLRFDLPARKFSVFGETFVATDLYLFALLLLIAAVGLFLFSALLGRLWCGWACPQTVFMEGVFRRIERWLEGTPLSRRKLDTGAHDEVFWRKKIAKHAIFLVLSIVLSLAFVAYFVGPWEALGMLRNFGADHPAAMVTAVILAALTYWNFSSFREQFCTFLCPYARFQSVMLDEHSLIIGYDPFRGEPRGPIRPDQNVRNGGGEFAASKRGDCIDCKRCVQVCPTGIDIRDGLQLECVSCTACIDACDAVMAKIGRPRGLIRYDSLAGLARRPRRVWRMRVALYAVITSLLVVVFSVRVAGRQALELTVQRSPGIPYMVQSDGLVRNLFSLHLTNSSPDARTVTVEIEGPPGLQLMVPGQPFALEAGEHVRAEAFVMFPQDSIVSAQNQIAFRLVDGNEELSRVEAVFLGPVARDQPERVY